MPTWASVSTTRSRSRRRRSDRCSAIASSIWSPTRKTGFREAPGFWKIIAMSLPRMRARAASSRERRSRPPNRTSPETRPGGRRISPRIASDVSDLPAPDSPTRPTISPRRIWKSTPSTARRGPSSELNSTVSPRTSRTIGGGAPAAAPPPDPPAGPEERPGSLTDASAGPGCRAARRPGGSARRWPA